MCPKLRISIHALLAESDSWYACSMAHTANFYPRSPCGERRCRCSCTVHNRRFLSTLSLRRATIDTSKDAIKATNFYPRSPCGERQPDITTRRQRATNFYPRSPCGERHVIASRVYEGTRISIHALLAESDAVVDNIVFVPGKFLSTLSLRRATSK